MKFKDINRTNINTDEIILISSETNKYWIEYDPRIYKTPEITIKCKLKDNYTIGKSISTLKNKMNFFHLEYTLHYSNIENLNEDYERILMLWEIQNR